MTSQREGWGIVVTEAASQGTPAVVYDVNGLRDSVIHYKTGLVSAKQNPQALAEAIVQVYKKKSLYEYLRINAWNLNKNVTFDLSSQQFLNHIEVTFAKPVCEGFIKLRRFRYAK